MFLLTSNGEIEAFNANQVEKLYIRYPSSTGSDYYEIVARMVSGREYVIFKGIDIDSTTEAFYAFYDEMNEKVKEAGNDTMVGCYFCALRSAVRQSYNCLARKETF